VIDTAGFPLAQAGSPNLKLGGVSHGGFYLRRLLPKSDDAGENQPFLLRRAAGCGVGEPVFEGDLVFLPGFLEVSAGGQQVTETAMHLQFTPGFGLHGPGLGQSLADGGFGFWNPPLHPQCLADHDPGISQEGFMPGTLSDVQCTPCRFLPAGAAGDFAGQDRMIEQGVEQSGIACADFRLQMLQPGQRRGQCRFMIGGLAGGRGEAGQHVGPEAGMGGIVRDQS
jgi:hypothetical protein